MGQTDLTIQLERDSFPVFTVSGKRTRDADEIFDGIPGLLDAEAASIRPMARKHSGDGA